MPTRPSITTWVGIGFIIGVTFADIKRRLADPPLSHWAWSVAALGVVVLLCWGYWRREVRWMRADLTEREKLRTEAGIGRRIQAEAKAGGCRNCGYKVGEMESEPSQGLLLADPLERRCKSCGLDSVTGFYPTVDDPRYTDLNDMQAIDAIVDEVEAGLANKGRCKAGWAMLNRLSNLRRRLDDKDAT